MERLIEHWQTMRRVQEENRLGQKRYVWESTNGVNHFASAMWFYWVARSRAMEDVVILHEKGGEDKKLIQVTSDGMKMMEIEEIFSEINNK